MDFIYIGKIVNTHGLKGEIRIISDFKYKDLLFKENMKLYVGKRKEEVIINSYRKHKMYDMVTLKGMNTIEDVIGYKGEFAYVNKSDLQIDGYFNEDLIGLEVYDDNKFIGIVNDIIKSEAHEILVIINNDKKYMIPNINEFIIDIDINKKKIQINNIRGLIDEN